jgi:cathepsin L
MKAALLGLVGVAAADLRQEFVEYMTTFNKEYTTEEVSLRYGAFVSNMKSIQEHNARGESWVAGVNKFTDLSPEEFSATYLGYKHRENDYMRSKNLHVAPKGQVLADSLDWRSKNAVTPVKDQAQCGSCWAFSTTGSMESTVFLATQTLPSLSEQELVDCAGSSGNQGCNGGLMDDAFTWIIKNGGLGSEESYPYTARDGTCKKVASVAKISGYTDVKGETDLMSAINMKPVSIAVNAQPWQTYRSGVFSGCRTKQLDHGVLLVGYGTDGSQDYWLIKNSWGASWGEQGYIRMVRGKDMCGLADAASYPTA